MHCAMDDRVTALERAFQLAKSGEYASVSAIKKQLKAERYEVTQITGRALSKQLNDLIKAAQS